MASLDKKIESTGRQRFVNSVFDRVATRYDLMNDLMSGGVHRLWKDAAIAWLAPSPSVAADLLDVAGGTGDITKRYLRAAGPGSRAVICDISGSMLEEGRRRLEAQRSRARCDSCRAMPRRCRSGMARFSFTPSRSASGMCPRYRAR